MAAVRFHPAADEALVDATDWYLARSGTAALGFVREIEHALARIGEAPERYPLTRFGRRRSTTAGSGGTAGTAECGVGRRNAGPTRR